MKLKGVNPIAQHIEKAVLGVTAIIFLAVISMQFVTEPNKVDTGNRLVSPDQIYNDLASTANALQSQISDLSPSLPEVQPVDLLTRYNSAFATDNQTTTTELASALGTGIDIASLLGTEIQATSATVGAIEAMTVPVTSTPLASSSWATLDPYAVLEVPEYADFVPTAQPFDFPTVSIEADFSGTKLNDVLEGNDGYPGVPRLFWISTGMAVMGLDVERQELQADGSWSDSQSITTPPNTPLPTQAVTKDDGLVRLNNIIASAQEVADEVMRPMYPPTISGPAWQPPSELLDSSDLELTETQQLQRRLSRLNSQVDGLKNPASSRSTTTRSPGGGGGKTTSRDPGMDPGSGGGGSRNTSDRTKNKIEKLEEQIESIKEDLESLGVDAQDALSASATDILDQEFIQLWAHDMGVEPGATYRYRTRAVLNNPYFRKGPYLDETDDLQQSLTVEPFASGDWSDWSDPVDVGAKEFFFVTDATQPVVGAGLPQAKIELYSMYYGYYRRSSMTIEPGQSLLANLRVSGDLVLMDTAAIESDDAAKYIQDQNDGLITDSILPDGLTEAPDRLSINLGAFLIQVASDPVFSAQNPGKAGSNLIFRLINGSIQHRDSTSDKSSQLYTQAQSSSTKASRSQLRPTGQPAKSEAAALFVTVEP